MKKQKKLINLGEDFALQKNGGYHQGNFKALNECYKTCSTRKVYVYNYYKNLLLENSDTLLKYGVASFNCNIITLEAELLKNNKKYYCYITPTKNLIYEV